MKQNGKVKLKGAKAAKDWFRIGTDELNFAKAGFKTSRSRTSGGLTSGGLIHFAIREKYLNSRIIIERPPKAEKASWIITAKRPAHIPAANHPWRKLLIKNQATEFLKTSQI